MRSPRSSVGRTPAFRKAAGGSQVSQSSTVPAPVGGWNSRQSLSEMEEIYAVDTNNFFGETTDVRVRKGYADHVTGIGYVVESLMPYNAADGTQTLFAAATDNKFYDVTTAGAVGAAVVTGQTNARWQHINFTNSAGTSYLCCFNGADSPQYWDGSSWITVTGASSPLITGLTTSDIVSATVFKRRIFLILNNSLDLYYLKIDSVGGAANALSLAGYMDKGGYLVAAGTWTIDGGQGVDDRLVVISSEGQIAVFEGTNPSSVSTWGLVGVWNVGEPIGRRCMIKYGSDLLVLTVQGLFPLSVALQSGEGNDRLREDIALTYNINLSMAEAALKYRGNFGWSMAFFPQGNQLFLNVPIQEAGEHQQYVMNSISRSWWRFTSVNASCWAVIDKDLYFGTNGEVVKFGGERVFNDNGDEIAANIKQAFSYLGSRGRLKHVKSMRPNILASGTPAASMAFAVDFGDEEPPTGLSFTPITVAAWDTAVWDAGTWGGNVVPFNVWQTVGVVGTALSPRLRTSVDGVDFRLASTDFVFEYGGVIA